MTCIDKTLISSCFCHLASPGNDFFLTDLHCCSGGPLDYGFGLHTTRQLPPHGTRLPRLIQAASFVRILRRSLPPSPVRRLCSALEILTSRIPNSLGSVLNRNTNTGKILKKYVAYSTASPTEKSFLQSSPVVYLR